MKRDPIELEVFKNIYHSIAKEMGAALQRTAFSPNIKERRDYSCAVFNGNCEVVAPGDHIPVHFGSRQGNCLGGGDGERGKADLMRADGQLKELPGKFSTRAKKGDRIRIETPGGGFGSA